MMLKAGLTLSIMTLLLLLIMACNKDENESSSDTNPPVITIIGPNPIFSQKDSAYTDPGATALDDVDGDITANIQTTSNVNINIEGDYTVNYRVSDRAGNLADTFRVVRIRIF